MQTARFLTLTAAAISVLALGASGPAAAADAPSGGSTRTSTVPLWDRAFRIP